MAAAEAAAAGRTAAAAGLAFPSPCLHPPSPTLGQVRLTWGRKKNKSALYITLHCCHDSSSSRSRSINRALQDKHWLALAHTPGERCVTLECRGRTNQVSLITTGTNVMCCCLRIVRGFATWSLCLADRDYGGPFVLLAQLILYPTV